MRTRLIGACMVALLLARTAGAQPVPPPAPAPARAQAADEMPDPRPANGILARAGVPWAEPGPGAPDLGLPVKPVCGPIGKVWVSSEVLLWWVQGTHLPPLVNASPAGGPIDTVGIGAGAASVLGAADVNGGPRLGFRTRLGGWLDETQRVGVEAEFLMLSSAGFSRGASSNGSLNLARPVTGVSGNPADPTLTATSDAISFPGVVSGQTAVGSSTGNLIGAGIWVRENIYCTGDPCTTCRLCNSGGCGPNGCGTGDGCDNTNWVRVDSIIGYRYLRFSDRLDITDNLNNAVARAPLPAGSVQRFDQFATSNQFNGVDLGGTTEIHRSNWYLNVTGKAAVGWNYASVWVNGATTSAAGTTQGGLYAQNTNIGRFTRTEPTIIPELNLQLGYQIRPNMRIYAGYTFLYWFHLARAIDQVDPNVDQAFIPGKTGTGTPVHPAFSLQDSDNWIQGVSMGFEWRF